MKKILLALACSLALAPCASFAEQEAAYPKQVFDASYKSSTPEGKGTVRYSSDGKGHFRQEETVQGKKVVSIVDYNDHRVTTLMEVNHMAITQPFKPVAPKMSDADFVKNPDYKSAGNKVIDGHPCHGYKSEKDGVITEVWIGDDIKHLVKSEVHTDKGLTSLTMVSFSSAEPPADLFTVPPGYNEMDMPKLGRH